MKKIYSVLLSLLAAAVWGVKADAETVDNYSYGFEGISSTTLAHDWAPSGWGHIIDGDDYNYEYVSYKGDSSAGVDGTGCLKVGSQNLYTEDGLYEAQDMLVTPVVSGHVTIMFQSTSYYSAALKFFNVTESGTSFKAGTQITTATIPELTYGEWIKAEIDLAEPQRIGIYASSGYLDNFTADKAEIVKKPALTIKGVKAVCDEKIDCTADGKFTIAYKAVVQNTGMLDLAPGDDNYSLSLVNNSNKNEVLATVPITQALAMNAVSDTITLEATLEYEQYSSRNRYDVMENVSGTSQYGSWVQPVPYKPVLLIKNSNNSEVSTGTEIDFGMQTKQTSKNYTITNDGGAPLTVSEVVASDGFATTLKPVTIKPHATLSFEISMLTDVAGQKEGTLTLKSDGIDDFTFKLKGNVVDGTKYFENFEENKFAVNIIAEDGWEMSSFPQAASISGNMYCAMEDETSKDKKLITPLLEVKEGDTFQFEAGKTTSSGCHMNVYYSTDRKNWNKVRSLSVDAENEADKFSNTKVGSTWSSNYEMTSFVIDNIPAGQVYLAFEAGGVHLDNLYGFKPVAVSHDIYAETTDIPASAMVNYELTAKASFKNINTEAEAAGSYKAILHFGDKEITAEDAPAIKAGETKEFSFSLTPHTAGTVKAYIELKGADFSVTSSEVDIVVADEVANNTVAAGEFKGASIDAPMNPYYNHSVSELLYTADDIKLAAGTKISSIEFRGYNPDEATYTTMNVYMANTEDAAFANPYSLADVTAMTNVFSGSCTLAKVGDGSNYTSSAEVKTSGSIVKLSFAEPFVYDGKSLRIVLQGDVEHYKSRIAWETTDKEMAMASNYDYSTSTFSSAKLPVAYLGIVKAPVAVKGTVTNSETKAAVEGASVVAKSGNVEYYATTDADGKYSIAIVQDTKAYTVTVTKTGYAPAKAEGMTFDGADVEKDFAIGKANGFYIDEKNIPATGNVNSLYTAKVKALNPETADIAADSYTAKLYFGDDVVAEAEPKAVASGEYADYSFSFYPHHTGTYSARVEFAYGEKNTASEPVSVEISEETTLGNVQVGDSTAIDNSDMPMALFFRNSESDMVYTAKQLGLNKGTVINRIRFRGYVGDGYNTKSIQPNIRVYIANSDEEAFDENSYEMPDTTQMTKIYDANTTYTTGVSDMHSPIDVLDLAIEGGFKYTGKSLRIFVHHDCENYQKTYFITDANIKGQAMYRAIDKLEDGFKWKSSSKGMPVLYMDVTSTGVVSGKVADKKDQTVAGAAVTLKSDGIEYYGTTAEDGTYSINVGKIGLTYGMEVEAEGFEPYTAEGIAFADELNITADASLSKYNTVSGTVLGKDLLDDDTKAVALQGVNVKLVSEDGTVSMDTTTDAEGKYSFDILDVFGKYTLSFSKTDYKDNTVEINGEYDDVEVPEVILQTITSGINTVGSNGIDLTRANVKVFTLGGEKVSEGIGAAARLPRGTYIIKGNDGTVSKISIR